MNANNYFNRVSLFILSSLSLTAMEKPSDIKQPQTIDDIPEFCVSLVKKLDTQPPQVSIFENIIYKKLSFDTLADFYNSKICQILSANDQISNPLNCWNISTEDDIGEGLLFKHKLIHCHNFKSEKKPSFSELVQRYHYFIQQLKRGWRFEKANNYPDILHTHPETTHYLLIKEKQALDESGLVTFLAAKFNITYPSMCCDTDLKSIATNREFIYLWVKKEAWKQFQSIFKLEVEEPKN